MLLCDLGLYSKSFISLNSCSSDLGIIGLTLAMFRQKSLHTLDSVIFPVCKVLI